MECRRGLAIRIPSVQKRVPGFGTGSGTLEPVPWNRFLRQITTCMYISGVSVSVFDVGIGIRYFCRYFFTSVRYSVPVF